MSIERTLKRLNPWARSLIRGDAALLARPKARMALRVARRVACMDRVAAGRAAVLDWAHAMHEIEPGRRRLRRVWKWLAHVDLSHAVFARRVDLSATPFVGSLDFSHARFLEGLSLHGASIRGRAAFRSAELGGAVLSGAQFRRCVDFSGASVDGDVDAAAMTALGAAYFNEARWRGVADFSRAAFNHDAVFDHSHFFDGALFGASRFSGLTRFHATRFCGETTFEAARFGDAVSFDGARFKYGAELSGAYFSRPRDDAATADLVARGVAQRGPTLVFDRDADRL